MTLVRDRYTCVKEQVSDRFATDTAAVEEHVSDIWATRKRWPEFCQCVDSKSAAAGCPSMCYALT